MGFEINVAIRVIIFAIVTWIVITDWDVLIDYIFGLINPFDGFLGLFMSALTKTLICLLILSMFNISAADVLGMKV